ncbi:hypothetical protein B7L70_04880 [Vulcanisaeta sp. EB80]|nr:hypothetical protein B7L70_04880 [Vulcanisaeta sp. EB80]
MYRMCIWAIFLIQVDRQSGRYIMGRPTRAYTGPRVISAVTNQYLNLFLSGPGIQGLCSGMGILMVVTLLYQ